MNTSCPGESDNPQRKELASDVEMLKTAPSDPTSCIVEGDAAAAAAGAMGAGAGEAKGLTICTARAGEVKAVEAEGVEGGELSCCK